MKPLLHLQKLSVGTDCVEDLADWQAMRRAQTEDGFPRHITRMWPKREDAVRTGSIYWVIKGVIQCRQRILRLEAYDSDDGIRRCAIVLDPALVRTTPAPRRPFQGWRYLTPEDAPRDLTGTGIAEHDLPASLAAELAEIGVL